MTTEIFCFYLQNGLIQTSQTGGQWYSDSSPFSIPWLVLVAPVEEQKMLRLSSMLKSLYEVKGSSLNLFLLAQYSKTKKSRAVFKTLHIQHNLQMGPIS
jgi:hypothetical protein